MIAFRVTATWPLLGSGISVTAGIIGCIVVIGAVARPQIVRTRSGTPGITLGPPARGRASDPLVSRTTRRAVSVSLAMIGVLVVGAIGTGAVVAGSLLVGKLGALRAERRRRAADERALPEAVDLLVLSVRAGLTPHQAVREVATTYGGTIGDTFGEVVRRTERGQPFADALGALPERLGAHAAGLADVIATSDRHGLPLGPVLDQLTNEVRATRRRLDQAAARTLPVRLSFPLVLCTLPSFVLLAIAPAVIAALSSLGGTAW